MFNSEFIVCDSPAERTLSPIANRDLSTPLSISSSSKVYSIVDGKGNIVKHAHRWLRYLSKSVGVSIGKGTVAQYGRAIVYFVRWLEEDNFYPNLSADEALEVLTRQDIRAWVSYMSETNLEAATIRLREVGLKLLLEWLTTNDGGNVRSQEDNPYGRDLENPLKYVSKSSAKKSPKFIDTSTIIAVLSNFHNECERCMFHAQYDTGLRIGEIIDLRLCDLPKAENFPANAEFIPIVVQGLKGRGGQSKERITLISKSVLNRIKRYHSSIDYKLAPDWDMNDQDKPVFLTANQLPWQYRNAKKQFDNAIGRAGLDKQFKNHWLRHGTAFSVLRSNIGRSYEDRILAVQQMLGHAYLSTTEIYTQISPALLSELTKKGHELDRAEEAQNIREATYLAGLKHSERRGHNR